MQEKEVTRMNIKLIHGQNENKKYDCTKAKDFLHELKRASEWCRKRSTSECRECEMICRDGGCFLGLARNLDIIPKRQFDFAIQKIQNWSDRHPEKVERKRPVLTEDDITVLKALQIMGYHWIAEDKNGGISFAYIEKPTKYYDDGVWSNSSSYSVNYTFPFISWEDEEPTNIGWLLGGNDNE